ncbi:UDP-3-O-(3-hydroxymyristoyl)glucosamine N-acyltransferase [Candidatus Neomarinimicrobiota bacterium]
MPTLAEIAQLVDGKLDGDGSIQISHACEIESGTPGGITFLADHRYVKFLPDSQVSAVVVDEKTDTCGKAAIRIAQPYLAFTRIVERLYPDQDMDPGIDQSASIDPSAKIGKGVSIGPNAVIEQEVQIGAGSIIGAGVKIGRATKLSVGVRLYPNVVLYHEVEIGANTVVNSGTVIGSDGFGFVSLEDKHHKIPHIGRVVIGENVEIGSNCSIDRGSLRDTVIGDGTKLDNMIQIAHSVSIGRGCLLAGMVGIAGSTEIGDFVVLAAQVGVVGHISIGDRAIVAGKAAVRQSLEGGKVYAGDPARERTAWLRQMTLLGQLGELVKRVKKIETELF